MAPTYRWHRRFLQHLQSEHMAERWLLKSPAHLWCLPALLAEYPDAIVIQNHRDPLKVIASISALGASLREMTTDSFDVRTLAAQYGDDIMVGLDRALDARRDGLFAPGQVVDVRYQDLRVDPIGAVARDLRRDRPRAHRRRRGPHARVPGGAPRRPGRQPQAVLVRRHRPGRSGRCASGPVPTRSSSTSNPNRSAEPGPASPVSRCVFEVAPSAGRLQRRVTFRQARACAPPAQARTTPKPAELSRSNGPGWGSGLSAAQGNPNREAQASPPSSSPRRSHHRGRCRRVDDAGRARQRSTDRRHVRRSGRVCYQMPARPAQARRAIRSPAAMGCSSRPMATTPTPAHRVRRCARSRPRPTVRSAAPPSCCAAVSTTSRRG